MLGNRALGAFIILGSLFLGAPYVWGCSCVGPRGREILTAHAAVFTGKATRVQYLEPDRPDVEPPIVVTFEVYQAWKGPVRRTAVLRTIYNKWSCNGYYFKEGREYLVAAARVTEDAVKRASYDIGAVSLCGGTRELSDAKEDLADLGIGKKLR